ncbi:hypothetical protein JUJ52_17675 [Virgibacillus sp. AGTR]|uniref:hypothetical protein n=1 Tax=Virgibacillus sp. AGTR TaxID=2812055 RepID=UPI001D16C58F|nr:hypothetical protein [Virgibacillus sp. AGTR]MCC2251780.1 hypothetical protein [Virgibacillus sp. AGTR]
MALLDKMILGSSKLPTLDGVENWGTTIVVQAVTLIVVFMVAKNLARFKIGGIIATCVIGGIVAYVVQNWDQVSSWVKALIDTL